MDGEAWEGITDMTVRELIHNTKNYFLESYNDTTSWFIEGGGKIVNGNFLDLTIGQALLVLFIAWSFLLGIKESINDAIKDFRSPRNEDKPEE